MREKKQPILVADQKVLFKKCLISLDPALALNNNFINNSFEMHSKREPAKIHYMQLYQDKYRKIEGFVNTLGTRVILIMKTSHDFSARHPVYDFNKRLVWNPEGIHNEKAIETYREFKEMSSKVRDNAEADEALRQHQREVCNGLMDTLPNSKERKIRIDINYSWSPGLYRVNLTELTEDQVELVTRTLKPIV